MNKTEKTIKAFFKPYFEKYPLMELFEFNIYQFTKMTDGGKYSDFFMVADEDFSINGKHWDECCDEALFEASYKIQDAIRILQNVDSKNYADIIKKLHMDCGELQAQANASDPLNPIYRDVWSDKNQEMLNEKLAKSLKSNYPWKYIDYLSVIVRKDKIEIIEQEENR